jgi:ABC-type multidrug transport system fused ATPase/permease subunit
LNKNTDKKVFIKYIGLIILVQIIVNMSNNITSYIEAYFIPDLNHYIINYIFKNLLRKYENSISEIELGKITSRLSTIPGYVKDFITDFFVWLFPRFFTILLINLYFFYINFNLGLISSILLILFLYINGKYFQSCSKLSLERHGLFEQHNQNTQDLLSNSASIYSVGNTDNEINKYDFNTKIYTSKFKENLLCINKINIISGVFIVILFAILNIYTVYIYYKKKISYTNLLSIFIMILYYIPCIITIGLILPSITHSYGPIKSIDNFVKDLYNIEKNHENSISNKNISKVKTNDNINSNDNINNINNINSNLKGNSNLKKHITWKEDINNENIPEQVQDNINIFSKLKKIEKKDDYDDLKEEVKIIHTKLSELDNTINNILNWMKENKNK